ncbi:MAG: cache domain-containing protein [Pseudolabrys sp.]|nr:cache domain-containing protein [Pseudolabrys sp.]
MRRVIALLLLAAFALPGTPAAAEVLSAKRVAVFDMVKRMQATFARDGLGAAVAAANDPSNTDFHDRDLYVFVYNKDGVCLANGARPALVGKNLISIKDQDGKYLIQEMISIAYGPGHGWLEYKWPSPITNRIADRGAYIEKMGEYFVGVGYDK